MPAHRHSSTPRSSGGPYKASIIVISSDDEDEEPVLVPKRGKRGTRKPRPSRAEDDVFEILDETHVKAEEPELESLLRRCNELEQACFFIAT
jgi:hypothetical protein